MTLEILFKTLYYEVSLRNDFRSCWHSTLYGLHEHRIVSAAEYESINKWVTIKELADAFLYKIVCSVGVGFACFDYCCPQRTCLSRHFYVGKELRYLEFVAV